MPLPSKEFLLERSIQRAKTPLPPKDKALLWPPFTSRFQSIYERRDTSTASKKKLAEEEEAYSQEEEQADAAVSKEKSSIEEEERRSKEKTPSTKYDAPLLPGEASAILPYIQSGRRIPRRGEIGLTSESIERFERAGYVMSGSRNAYMTAMRMKKENAVMSVEEEKRLLKLSIEAKKKHEEGVVASFRSIIDKKKQQEQQQCPQQDQQDNP